MSRLLASGWGDEPAKITGGRLSKLQKRLLCWLDGEERRTNRISSSSHQQLVQALPNAKGNISVASSRSSRLGEHRSLARGPSGKCQAHLARVPEGL